MAVVGACLGLGLTAGAVQADSSSRERGTASDDGSGFQGHQTASGDRFAPQDLTTAHRQLPWGTKVMLDHLDTGAQVEGTITDPGPSVDTPPRILDRSTAAADRMGLVAPGMAPGRVIVTETAAIRQNSPAAAVVYAVQVGAVDHSDQVEAVLAQVQDWWPTAASAPHQGPAGADDRVRVGPLPTRDAAQVRAALPGLQG